MNAAERRREILKRISEQQSIEIQALADTLRVSTMTIRRDVKILEQEGFIRQTYGGATLQITKSIELGFNSRSLELSAEKRKIAMHAANLIQPGQTIFLGPGTTTAHFAQFLLPHPHIRVITSTLSHASLLRSRQIPVTLLGGELKADELYSVGSMTQHQVQEFNADVCVLGVAGIDLKRGLTELDIELAHIHRIMLERSAFNVILADHSKLNFIAPAVVASVQTAHLMVIDQISSSNYQEFIKLGVNVHVIEETI